MNMIKQLFVGIAMFAAIFLIGSLGHSKASAAEIATPSPSSIAPASTANSTLANPLVKAEEVERIKLFGGYVSSPYPTGNDIEHWLESNDGKIQIIEVKTVAQHKDDFVILVRYRLLKE